MKRSIGALCTAGFAGLAVICASAVEVAAQTYPTKPIRLIVGAGPGGGTDIVARIVAEHMPAVLGQPVVVENRPGAGGTIAGNVVAKTAPDGYTIMAVNNGSTTAQVMYAEPPFRMPGDFATISLIGHTPLVVVTAMDSPHATFKDLIAAARADGMMYGAPTIGGTQHFATEYLAQVAEVKLRHIPYGSSPNAIAALQSGEVPMLVETVPAVLGQVRGDAMKALAVTSAERYPGLPEVPTAAETAVPGFVVTTWYGLVAPAGTPGPVIAKLNDAVRKTIADEAVRERLMSVAVVPEALSPEAFDKFMRDHVARWAEVRERAAIPQR